VKTGTASPWRWPDSQDEIELVSEHNTLTVSGAKEESENRENGEYLYRGIATRSFERRFQLADHVEVDGAKLENGLLHIELKRELPEQMKPRKIEISNGDGRLLEGEREAKVKAA
jgi:molecular chaperone IbpA